ncbi:AI-2E family transporter [Polaribacter sejongensis]|uniref:AI-2E family transporter n=1 Tax=Polaribacter sejongensis TaxID=985043 RepID=A0AAJ1QVG9_9FLAO|nr:MULTISPECIES: AI-2E family transporter [Polaribacter]AUC22911.1 AI-2E family transporter [Polaribacter sejongensis]MDN3618810.1 AI-2E family transporter [Polaribacter undariae]UWD32901.1 AI-2E family transporter [Polaribacter undariae]
MKDTIAPRIIRQIFVLLLILFILILIFRELIPYLSGVLGAITIFVLLRKAMLFLVNKNWKPNIAAAFLIVVSFIGILLPISGILLMLANKVRDVVGNSEEVVSKFKTQMTSLESKVGYNFTDSIDAEEVSSWITDNLQGFVGSTFNIFISIGLMYFLLYFMLVNEKILRQSLYKYLPINEVNLKIIGSEAKSMVRSNTIGIPLVAIAQGIIALIGFLIFDINNPFFWFTIVTVGSMIPFIGTFVGILPVFILTLASGDSVAAWGILIYGIVVVGSTDNIIRLLVLKKLDDVHPLITLIGVIVGVPLFGFIGLIFGPLLISLFLVIVKIYRKEFAENNI